MGKTGPIRGIMKIAAKRYQSGGGLVRHGVRDQ
jgi:hypothetical protein